jgi:hypothetical protein
MASHYTVLQYVPNALTGERANVGIIAFDDTRVVCRTLHNWRRVSSFGGSDVHAVRELVEEFTRRDLSPTDVTRALETWTSSLRLSAPRASVAPVDRLLEQMAEVMLVDVEPKQRLNTKLTVMRNGRVALERAVDTKVQRADLTVESRLPVDGYRVSHDVDLAVQNGRVLLVAQAVSFARSTSQSIQRDVDATAWILEDLGSSATPPHLAVLVAPPTHGNKSAYDAGLKLFRELKAEVVPQNTIGSWADKAVAALNVA